jgi:signal transduction histidine kinase
MRRALDDPTAELLVWTPELGAYVDSTGIARALPGDDDPRATTLLRYADRRIGAILHDPALLESQDTLMAVAAAVRMGISKDLLQQELVAKLEALTDLLAEQAALRRVATIVASDSAPEEIFRVVAEEAATVLRTEAGAVVRVAAETAPIVGRWNVPGLDGIPVGTTVRLDGDSSIVRVWRTGRAARIDDYTGVQSEPAEQIRRNGFRATVAAPIGVGGAIWGALVVGTARDEPLPGDTERRLGAFAELVSSALAGAHAREQVLLSRARIVEAGDAERRRLERNLHDGAQQRLATLALTLRRIEQRLHGDAAVAGLLAEAREELALALEELRELARGIHPAVLTERGLVAAVEGLARRSPIPVELDVDLARSPAGPEEAAAYYVVSEALANVIKYAGASVVHVRMTCRDGDGVVEVEDDGVGGADAGKGSGLRGLADRVEALGGRFELQSPPGGGTVVRASIPCKRPSF